MKFLLCILLTILHLYHHEGKTTREQRKTSPDWLTRGIRTKYQKRDLVDRNAAKRQSVPTYARDEDNADVDGRLPSNYPNAPRDIHETESLPPTIVQDKQALGGLIELLNDDYVDLRSTSIHDNQVEADISRENALFYSNTFPELIIDPLAQHSKIEGGIAEKYANVADKRKQIGSNAEDERGIFSNFEENDNGVTRKTNFSFDCIFQQQLISNVLTKFGYIRPYKSENASDADTLLVPFIKKVNRNASEKDNRIVEQGDLEGAIGFHVSIIGTNRPATRSSLLTSESRANQRNHDMWIFMMRPGHNRDKNATIASGNNTLFSNETFLYSNGTHQFVMSVPVMNTNLYINPDKQSSDGIRIRPYENSLESGNETTEGEKPQFNKITNHTAPRLYILRESSGYRILRNTTKAQISDIITERKSKCRKHLNVSMGDSSGSQNSTVDLNDKKCFPIESNKSVGIRYRISDILGRLKSSLFNNEENKDDKTHPRNAPMESHTFQGIGSYLNSIKKGDKAIFLVYNAPPNAKQLAGNNKVNRTKSNDTYFTLNNENKTHASNQNSSNNAGQLQDQILDSNDTSNTNVKQADSDRGHAVINNTFTDTQDGASLNSVYSIPPDELKRRAHFLSSFLKNRYNTTEWDDAIEGVVLGTFIAKNAHDGNDKSNEIHGTIDFHYNTTHNISGIAQPIKDNGKKLPSENDNVVNLSKAPRLDNQNKSTENVNNDSTVEKTMQNSNSSTGSNIDPTAKIVVTDNTSHSNQRSTNVTVLQGINKTEENTSSIARNNSELGTNKTSNREINQTSLNQLKSNSTGGKPVLVISAIPANMIDPSLKIEIKLTKRENRTFSNKVNSSTRISSNISGNETYSLNDIPTILSKINQTSNDTDTNISTTRNTLDDDKMLDDRARTMLDIVNIKQDNRKDLMSNITKNNQSITKGNESDPKVTTIEDAKNILTHILQLNQLGEPNQPIEKKKNFSTINPNIDVSANIATRLIKLQQANNSSTTLHDSLAKMKSILAENEGILNVSESEKILEDAIKASSLENVDNSSMTRDATQVKLDTELSNATSFVLRISAVDSINNLVSTLNKTIETFKSNVSKMRSQGSNVTGDNDDKHPSTNNSMLMTNSSVEATNLSGSTLAHPSNNSEAMRSVLKLNKALLKLVSRAESHEMTLDEENMKTAKSILKLMNKYYADVYHGKTKDEITNNAASPEEIDKNQISSDRSDQSSLPNVEAISESDIPGVHIEMDKGIFMNVSKNGTESEHKTDNISIPIKDSEDHPQMTDAKIAAVVVRIDTTQMGINITKEEWNKTAMHGVRCLDDDGKCNNQTMNNQSHSSSAADTKSSENFVATQGQIGGNEKILNGSNAQNASHGEGRNSSTNITNVPYMKVDNISSSASTSNSSINSTREKVLRTFFSVTKNFWKPLQQYRSNTSSENNHAKQPLQTVGMSMNQLYQEMKKLVEEEESGKHEEKYSDTSTNSTVGKIKFFNDTASINTNATKIEGSTKAANESISSILGNPGRIVIIVNDNNKSTEGTKRNKIKQ